MLSQRSLAMLGMVTTLAVAAACNSDDEGANEASSSSQLVANDAEAAQAAAAQAEAAEVLLDTKELTHAFIEDDPTLDLKATAGENAGAIYDRISSVLAVDCPSVVPTHTRGTVTVAVDFAACTLPGGAEVTGQVSVTVERKDVNDGLGKELVVTFSLTQVTLGRVVVDGTVVVSTQTLTSYPVKATLDVNTLGALHFDGTIAASLAETQLVATLDGNGTLRPNPVLTGRMPEVSFGNWSCAREGDAAFVVAGLRRKLDQCHAEAGNVTLTQAFGCTLRNQTASASTITTLAWDQDTPTTDVITSSTVTKVADQSTTGTTESVTLPWTCE